MSYVYDMMRRVWDERIAPQLDDDELAFRFGALIDAMHSANHRVDDAINKDREVDVTTRKLEQYVNGRRADATKDRRVAAPPRRE